MSHDLTALLAICAECPAMSISTTDVDGQPASAAVFFAYTQEAQIYFLSELHTQHIRNLQHSPVVAVELHPSVWDWREIRGLQLRGRAEIVTDRTKKRRAMQIYQERFSFVSGIRAQVLQAAIFAFTPEWARLVDNRRGFGFKQEWQFPSAG